MWTNMSTRGTLPWILVQGPKDFSNFQKKYMSTNVDLCYMILEESMKFVEMYLFLLTPCDFLQQWSQGVSMSRHQNICAHLCRALDDEHPVRCLSTWCWITFTGWGFDFLYFRGSICEIISRVVRFLPLLLSFGEKSGLSGTSTLSDTLLQEYKIEWHLCHQ